MYMYSRAGGESKRRVSIRMVTCVSASARGRQKKAQQVAASRPSFRLARASFFASLPLDTPNAGPAMLLSAILPPLTVHALQPPASFALPLSRLIAALASALSSSH